MKTILHKILLACDFCGGMIAYESQNKEALPEHWRVIQGSHYCPTCKPRYVFPTEDDLVGLELRRTR